MITRRLASLLYRALPPLVAVACGSVLAAEINITNPAQFRQALGQAQPGDVLRLAPGTWPAQHHFSRLRGTAGQPIVIAAADPERPPIFDAAAGSLQFSGCAHLTLRDLVVTNFSGNGLNFDDAGFRDQPAHHLILENLKVHGTSPEGNRDAIKLSGVVDFQIRGCTLSGWGIGGGSGVDMVGCHRGLIESNRLEHTDSAGSTGIQAKGGTSHILIRGNRFQNAGARAVNIGGSTGLEFFRPPLKPGEAHAEASQICVEANSFIGSTAPIAFVGVDGAVVRSNLIHRPLRWAVRILQETAAPGFVPCRHGEFTDNVVVFESNRWAEGGVNIGPGTAPETFRFARNSWYCLDQPDRSRPKLPVAEESGTYGIRPTLPEMNN